RTRDPTAARRLLRIYSVDPHGDAAAGQHQRHRTESGGVCVFLRWGWLLRSTVFRIVAAVRRARNRRQPAGRIAVRVWFTAKRTGAKRASLILRHSSLYRAVSDQLLSRL